MPYERIRSISRRASVGWCSIECSPHMWCSGTRNDRYRGGIPRISRFTFRYNLKEGISGQGLPWEEDQAIVKSGISRDKTKVHSDERKWSGGAADTCLKQDRMRCRDGVSTKDEVLFLHYCKPTWAYEFERTSWATNHGYLHKSGCSWCFIRGTCYLRTRERSGMKGNSWQDPSGLIQNVQSHCAPLPKNKKKKMKALNRTAGDIT